MASPLVAKGNCRSLFGQPDLQIYHPLMDYAEIITSLLNYKFKGPEKSFLNYEEPLQFK
jgi:hypothetical protein